MTTFIYALCEPGTRTVRYIGKSDKPNKRFKSHIRTSIKHKSHLGNWLRLLASGGEMPTLIVLRGVAGDGSEAEMRCIRLARGCGMDLVNSTDGGEGITMTAETRKKISDKLTGRKFTDEHRENLSNSQKGRPATGAQLSCLAVGHVLASTPERRAALSATMSGERNPMFGRSGPASPHFGNTGPACYNFGKKRGTSSRYHGVCWGAFRKKWLASIKVLGRNINLGGFLDELDAARAYDLAAVKHYGKNAVLNFP